MSNLVESRIILLHVLVPTSNILIYINVHSCSTTFSLQGRLPFKWMSPEALLMGQYSIKSDVWSFGILLWEVVTLGGNPYAGIPVESLCEMYSNNYRLPKPGSCPGYL